MDTRPRLSLHLSEMTLVEQVISTDNITLKEYLTELVRRDLVARKLLDFVAPTPAEALQLCNWFKDVGGAPLFMLVYLNENTKTKCMPLDLYIEFLKTKTRYRRTRISTDEKVCLRLRKIKEKYGEQNVKDINQRQEMLATIALQVAREIP